MRTLLFLNFMIMPLLLNSALSYAESLSPNYSVGLGLEVSSGTFGTDSTSTYVIAPLIIDWYPTERFDLELTVPYLYQQTKNTGVAVLGTGAKATARRNMNGQYTYVGGSTTVTESGTVANGGTGDDSVSGLGDITLTSGYTLLMDSDTSPRVRPTLYVKFPSADANKGLGTGKFDFGAGLAISKWLGNWLPFAEGRYVFQGASREEIGALDFVTADAGVGYSWNESLLTSMYARFGSSLFDGISAPLEARLKTVWRFREHTYSEVYALKGFSDGSPDYGGGVSVFTEF